ncbi:MAG: phosphoenolpyruvate--protein phosphotransferase [Opitutales bacterium]|nr:phosphoenolpyruvate--protein phosphotransferase [Opitutales bacterium]
MSSTVSTERTFKGIAAAPGVAHGPAFIFVNGEVDIPKHSVPAERLEEEISRFEQGLMETRRQISAIRAEVQEKVGEDEASIFDAHQLVLEDRALIEDTIKEVKETSFNIEYCFQTVANRYIDAFAQIDDDYIKERVSDIRDVTRRMLCNLVGHQDKQISELVDRNILVADDLNPSEAATLDVESVVAIVTEYGSRTSHAVIVARSLNIPSVVGVHGLVEKVNFGDQILVDGFEGVVVLNPSKETLERYGQIRSRREAKLAEYFAERNQPLITKDDRSLRLLLNVEGVESDDILRNSGADGVGLLRTEMLFLREENFPDEEAQLKVYRRIAEAMESKPVTIRTLDLGGDKNPHNSLYGYQEANPFMGFRAIRFCLEHPKVFKEQLRAILRASAFGQVQVLYPMISSCEELVAANALLEECKEELAGKGIAFDPAIRRGCMIEVPSAAVISDLLAKHCDFFSIGTNDLVQYLLAVDRINDRISHLYQPNHPAVMRALSFIFEAGKRNGIPVSVCGELAGDPLYAPLLFGLGADELSLSWSSLPQLKFLLRRMRMKDARRLAVKVLRSESADEIQAHLKGFCEEVMGLRASEFTSV